jgi:antagonist of KipI
MLSSAVTSGTIQVPANGNPIVLMADHQTTGGYPRIGQVVTVDIPLLAQAPPGHRISFGEVSLADAQHLYMLQEKKIQLIIRAVKLKAMSNLLL